MALVTTIRIDRLAELEVAERRLRLLEEWINPALLKSFEKYYDNRMNLEEKAREALGIARPRSERDRGGS